MSGFRVALMQHGVSTTARKTFPGAQSNKLAAASWIHKAAGQSASRKRLFARQCLGWLILFSFWQSSLNSAEYPKINWASSSRKLLQRSLAHCAEKVTHGLLSFAVVARPQKENITECARSSGGRFASTQIYFIVLPFGVVGVRLPPRGSPYRSSGRGAT